MRFIRKQQCKLYSDPALTHRDSWHLTSHCPCAKKSPNPSPLHPWWPLSSQTTIPAFLLSVWTNHSLEVGSFSIAKTHHSYWQHTRLQYESLLRPEEFSNIKHVNICLNQPPLDNLSLCEIVLQFPINSQHWLLFSVICDYYFNTSIVLSSNAGYLFLCQSHYRQKKLFKSSSWFLISNISSNIFCTILSNHLLVCPALVLSRIFWPFVLLTFIFPVPCHPALFFPNVLPFQALPYLYCQ